MAARPTKRRTRQPPEARRRQLLDAALELFASRGYDETGVGDIADGAGLAVGTVYLYFPSKEHILDALHRRWHEGLGEILRRAEEGLTQDTRDEGQPNHAELIEHLVDETAAYVSAHRRYCAVITHYGSRLPESAADDDLATEDLLAVLLQRGIERREIHTSDPRMTARLIDAAVGHPMQEAAARGEDLIPLATQTKEFLTKALAP